MTDMSPEELAEARELARKILEQAKGIGDKEDDYLVPLYTAEQIARALLYFTTARPIAEAPKDGTIIDVWLGDADDADVEFYCTPGTRRAPGWSWQGGKFRPVTGMLLPVFVKPTHFYPLPPSLDSDQ